MPATGYACNNEFAKMLDATRRKNDVNRLVGESWLLRHSSKSVTRVHRLPRGHHGACEYQLGGKKGLDSFLPPFWRCC